MGLDRSLDEEGIPDLAGPLPEKVATGDPQEGTPPPTDRPASLDWGTTADEQRDGESLDRKLARELPDEPRADDEPIVLVEPEGEDVGLVDDEKDAIARDADQIGQGLSAEEAAVHLRDR